MGLNVKGKINGAVASLAMKVGISWLLARVRDAAEGRLGPEWKARYWAWAGKKTFTGVCLAIIAIVPAALGYDDVAEAVVALGTAAVSVGLLDKAWRTEVPAWLKDSVIYRFLAAHSAVVTGLFSSAFALVQAGTCGGLDCKIVGMVLLGLAAIAVWAGLLDAAWRSAPPILARRDGRWEITLPGDGGAAVGLKIIGDTRSEVHDAWHVRQGTDAQPAS